MSRTDKTTGKFDTREDLEFAIHCRPDLSGKECAEAYGTSVGTVSRIRNPRKIPVKLNVNDYWKVASPQQGDNDE